MSTSIPQMSSVTSVPAGAYVELNGARKIALETIIDEAVRKAIAQADINGINVRIESLARKHDNDIATLTQTVNTIPIVYVDSTLDELSNNAVSNSAVTNAIGKFINLAKAINEIEEAPTEPTNYNNSTTWRTFDRLVAYTFTSGPEAGKTRIFLFRSAGNLFFTNWSGAPDGMNRDEVDATSRLWLFGNNLFQGAGSMGYIKPLGEMMAQHNFLTQEEYNNMVESEKDKFELYLTY